MGKLTTGTNNTAMGNGALANLTTTAGNTAIGKVALGSSVTGSYNTALGYQSLQTCLDGGNNVAVGYFSLQANTTGASNVAVGKSALAANITGASNVAVGLEALDAVTTSNGNIGIGNSTGSITTNLVTGTGCILLGHASYTTATDSDYATAIGYNVAGEAGYTTLGVTSLDIRAVHGTATWATVSDQRYKKDIVDSTAGLSFIKALQPRTFKYKTLGELPTAFRAYEADSTEVFKNSNTNHGFIAQEVKTAIDADSGLKDGFKLWDERDDGSQEVAEAALIPILVKAIQEQQTTIETLTARITALET
jgi:hypothetical protein